MARKLLLPLLLSLLPFARAFAQGQVAQHILSLQGAGARFAPVDLLKAEPATPQTDALWREASRSATVLRFNEAAAQALLSSAPDLISVPIPSPTGTLMLDLQRADILAYGFVVHRSSDGAAVPAPKAVHYRGMVRGEASSVVALSVFDGQVMGLIADAQGNRVIGPFERAPRGLHVLYNDRDLLGSPSFTCATPELPLQQAHPLPASGERTTRCVRFYWEAAYAIFQNKGSVANTVAYLTGLFNQSAVLFANDGIDVSLQETYVWDTPSPYNGTSSGARLTQFGTTRTSFNGDLAHLLDYGGYGGVAWLSTLCYGTSSRMAYSGIGSSFSNVPTYSWSINVVTHEQGHNMGSPHTHACAWNGNNTAIDGCGPTAGYTEGTCPTAPLPAGGGTIMSYCHLIGGVGLNFNLGFGPQPAQLIRDRVNASTCLSACGTSCDAPGILSAYPLYATSATLNWANTGASGYTLRWRALPAGAWNLVTGLSTNSYALSGLASATNYEFQVLAICPSGESGYSAASPFSTPAPCPDALEPNDTWQTAAPVTLPASIYALIATPADQDHYSLTIGTISNLNIYLAGMVANYDLYLLGSNGTVLASSTNTGTSTESINGQVNPGTYVVRVAGANGAFSATDCYRLSINASPASCPMPWNVAAANITYNSALITWQGGDGGSGGPNSPAYTYALHWRQSGTSTWTEVSGISGTSYPLGGLNPQTTYDVQVRTICGSQGAQGGTGSEWTATYNFTTLAAPCEVAPPIRLAVKVFLQGPFNTAAGTMGDAVRGQGSIPLNEPYSAMGLPVTGPTSITAPVLATTGNDAIVDWVVVELRDASSGSSVIERRAALLQRDGDVTALDGTSSLGFCSAPGIYHVAVRHRNHLGCMAAAPVTLGSVAAVVDFTSPTLATYGTEARAPAGNVRLLWAGNALSDGTLKYTGQNNDRDKVLVATGGSLPTNTITGYHTEDVNLDGVVKYTGTGNDRDPILTNIGGTDPSSTRTEQLP